MNDELFKNLQIKDIEELFRETPKSPLDQDTPLGLRECPIETLDTPIDCMFNEKLENNKFFLTDEDALLLDREDSPVNRLEDDNEMNCMDFEQ